MRRDARLYRATYADESTSCPTVGCKSRPLLLTHPAFVTALPSFYVCECGFIGQIGVGMVRVATPSRLSKWHYKAILACRRLKQLAPAYTIQKSRPLHEQLIEVMVQIKSCDGEMGEDGLCNCARYIGGLMVRYGKHGR